MWCKLLTGSTVGRLESLLLFLLGPGVDTEWCPSSKSPLTLLEGEVALLLLEPMESNFFCKKQLSMFLYFRLCHQPLSWPPDIKFLVHSGGYFNCCKDTWLTISFFNRSPGLCCFSLYLNQNATFQFGWNKFSKSVLICISPILNESTTLGPKMTLDWSLKTHV